MAAIPIMKFLIVAAICLGGLWLLNQSLVQRILRAERLFWIRFSLFFLIIITFILTNPYLNSIIVGIALILLYPIINAYLKGMWVILNSNIELDQNIRIGQYSGRVEEINAAGLHLLTNEAKVFIPYHRLAENELEIFSKKQPVNLSFTCLIQDDKKNQHSINDLEGILFDFPFLAKASKINIEQEDQHFNVDITLSNERYQHSLYTQLKKFGFTPVNQ